MRIERDRLSDHETVTWTIDSPITNAHMTVRDELSRCWNGSREPKAKHRVVETSFKQYQQILSSIAWQRARLHEIAFHLSFSHAVIEAHLLLFVQPLSQRTTSASRC
jgi:hypothetical protein